MVRTVTATRYVTALREGGSLPAIVEADDSGLYVVKFRGAGQGPKALIAEFIAGEIGRTLGLLVPEIVFIEIDPALGRNEPDFEIQALVKASTGLNLALDYLSGALAFDALIKPEPELELASAIVWFDAYITNPDRTARNTNLLVWHKRLWLIDHGAAMYFQHTWTDYLTRSRTPFTPIKEHVLLPFASSIAAVDSNLRSKLNSTVLEEIVMAVPDSWLEAVDTNFNDLEEHRAAYLSYLISRLEAAPIFVEEAINARARLV